MRFVDGVVDRLIVIIFALSMMQMPQFMAHYTQRLGGHVDEIAYQVLAVEKMVKESNKSLTEWIKDLKQHSDPQVSVQGDFLNNLIFRHENLKTLHQRLIECSVWERPVIFLATFQGSIAKQTLYDFEPGLPLSKEGLLFALIGMLLGTYCYKGIKRIPRLFTKKLPSH